MMRAVVLLSGGLDSATCLALARQQGRECHTVAFDYGQRHRAELQAAERLAATLGAASHRTIRLGLDSIGGSALTDASIAVPEAGGAGIPVTYVPARNTVFLALALGLAEVLDAAEIHIGINAVDYSGYPDCRPAFVAAFQTLADVATKAGVEGHGPRLITPLLHLTKAEIIRAGVTSGLDYALTVSCYQASPAGEACGRCDSCQLRAEGFREAGVADPTRYLVIPGA
jgi:7-cyano-7-deazaguanine synthase